MMEFWEANKRASPNLLHFFFFLYVVVAGYDRHIWAYRAFNLIDLHVRKLCEQAPMKSNPGKQTSLFAQCWERGRLSPRENGEGDQVGVGGYSL